MCYRESCASKKIGFAMTESSKHTEEKTSNKQTNKKVLFSTIVYSGSRTTLLLQYVYGLSA